VPGSPRVDFDTMSAAAEPDPESEPTSEPEPTPQPEPTSEPEASSTPQPEPTPEPAPTSEPAPTPAPEPTPAPTPAPEPTPAPARSGGWAWKLGVVLLTPLLALALLTAMPRKVDLIVDNPTQHELDVVLGDQLLGRVPAGGSSKFLDVTAGDWILRAQSADGGEETVARARLAAEFFSDRPTYLWSVGRQARYWVVSNGYGDQNGKRSAEPFLLQQDVLLLPAHLEPTLDKSFPKEVEVPRGATGAVRQALFSERTLDRLNPRVANVIVDNGAQCSVRLEILEPAQDQQVLGDLEPHSSVVLDGLRLGRVRLRVTQLGPDGQAGQVFETEGTLEGRFMAPRPVYVWNVGGLSDYLLVSRSFGDWTETVPAPAPFEPPGEFFPYPEDTLTTFNGFPGKVVTTGEGGALHRALWTRRYASEERVRRLVEEGALGQEVERRFVPQQNETIERRYERGELGPEVPPELDLPE
jgi:hypothetical protein